MREQFDVSIVICTYNRCDLLPEALESVLAQEAGDVRHELIVVDNNSTDRTREVIESFVERSRGRVRYIFEGKQGKPHALNTSIEAAHAQLLAFTDDDVRVDKSWVSRIKRAFDEHPEADMVGGKVLPLWEREPPAWLTRDHWSPIAIQDYGDAPVYSNADNPICLVGANMSVRRGLFDVVGSFDPRFGRIGASSTEDHEFQLRMWQAGKQGIYIPEIIVSAEVQARRLTKAYHRLWHTGHGKSHAMMRDPEFERSSGRLLDVPLHVYRQAAQNIAGWLKHTLRNRPAEAFRRELELRSQISFFRHRSAERFAGTRRGTADEAQSLTRFRGGQGGV